MKRIFKSVLTFAILLPCLFLLSACGGIKNLKNKTLVFSKVEVSGSLKAEDFENEYKTISFKFAEDKVTHVDGVVENDFTYKVENNKVFLKGSDEDYSETPYAELSGDYMIVTETYDAGTVKIYFKVK